MGRNIKNKNNSRSSKSFDQGPRDTFSHNKNVFSGPREMHKAKCSECGSECEVPFKPTEGKPVYCRECFRKKKAW